MSNESNTNDSLDDFGPEDFMRLLGEAFSEEQAEPAEPGAQSATALAGDTATMLDAIAAVGEVIQSVGAVSLGLRKQLTTGGVDDTVADVLMSQTYGALLQVVVNGAPAV